MLAHEKKVLMEEFLALKENSEEMLEYINGIVYMSPSPSPKHQRISGKLYVQLFHYLAGKDCEVFSAPFDVHLKKEETEEGKIVIPDLSVICDKKGFTETKYVGVPHLIVEILSPSNQAHDLVTKLNLYMTYGVQEYWIVNPMLHTVTVYSMNKNGMYEQQDVKVAEGIVESSYFAGFRVDVKELLA